MRSNQRIKLTKRLLQEGLLRIMEKKPLDKINVSELCDESGINRTTFYRHYSMPRDVLLEMQTQFVEQIQASFDRSVLVDSPSQYIEKMCTHLYEHSDLVKTFIRNNSEEEIIYLFDDLSRTLLSENKNINRHNTLDSAEIKLISAYLSGGGYFMLRRWLLEDIEKSPQEITQLVMSFFNREYTLQ